MRILRFLRSSISAGKDIDYYSKFSPSPLSMKQFLDFGKMIPQTCMRFSLLCIIVTTELKTF